MALNVEYGPISLAGGLAAAAGTSVGSAAGQQTAIQSGLSLLSQSSQYNAQQANRRAQDRAFELQQAMADRIAGGQHRTPAADNVAEHLRLETQNRRDEQNRTKTQLDNLLSKGQISETQYGQAMAGVLSGSKGLIDRAIIPAATTDPMQKPLFAARLQMIRDQRAAHYNELKETQAASLDPLKSRSIPKGKLDQIKTNIDQTYKDEATLLAEASKSAVAPADMGGSLSMTPVPNAQEGNILNLARSMAGPGAAPIGYNPQPGAPSGQQQTLMAPPVEQRTVGQTYMLPNGKQGTWRGQGWEIQ